MSQTTKLDPIASTAHAMADAAGEVTLAFFRRGDLAVSNKAVGAERFDPVTEADRGAERAIRAVIAEHFPDDRILGEEFEAVTGDGAREWVIDPIDGTGAFICGLPTWGTLIGLRDSERVHFGLMDQPFTRERYWGGAEDGSFFAVGNAAPARLATDQTRNVSAASLATTDAFLFADPSEAAAFGRVASQARTRRYGLDCYAYARLAAGTIDLVIESGLQPYDIVALIGIVEGAGGVVTDWDGGSAINGGRIIAAANQELHSEALKLLAGG